MSNNHMVFGSFAITQMIKAKVDFDSAEYLVGHKSSRGIRVHYDRTTQEDRLEGYLKAVDLLTINPENRLRRQVEQLTIQSDKLKELSAQMDRLNKKLGLDL